MSKVKVSVAHKTMKDKQLIGLFNQMMGEEAPDPNVVVPKYEKLMKRLSDILGILANYVKFMPADIQSEFPKGVSDIVTFVTKAQADLETFRLEPRKENTLSPEELKLVNSNPEEMHRLMMTLGVKYDVDKLGTVYKSLKDSELVKSVIMTLRLFKEALGAEAERQKIKIDALDHEHDLADTTALRANFIRKSLGDVLHLLSFSNLNFKALYLWPLIGKASKNQSFYNVTLYTLHLLYDKCQVVYRLVSSPDIDVDKFAEALVANIGNIKKQIPRCDAAFRKIEESVEMLRDNFGGYYKDFIQSQNPGIIVENFVLDVAKGSEANRKVTRQFRQIINFYKSRMQGQIKDPKIKRIFDLVGKNLNILEDKTSKRGGDEDSAEEPEQDDEESAEEPELTPEEKAERAQTARESFLPDAIKTSSSNRNRKRNPPKRRGKKKRKGRK